MKYVLLIACASGLFGADFYVSSSATAGGDGSVTSPWRVIDVCTGNSSSYQPAAVTAALASGNVNIYFRGGTYTGGWDCRVKGTDASHLVVLRAYPDEHVIVDGTALDGTGQYTINLHAAAQWMQIRDFEIYSSYTGSRSTTTSGSNGVLHWPEGLEFHASHSKAINLIIHDLGQGIGFWSDAVDSELYGNIIYNVGWDGPDRGHGHTIYSQNNLSSATKKITANWVGEAYDYDWHIYGQSGQTSEYAISKNITPRAFSLFGGDNGLHNIAFDHNFWFTNTPTGYMTVGYTSYNTGISFAYDTFLNVKSQVLATTDLSATHNTYRSRDVNVDWHSRASQDLTITADYNRHLSSIPADIYQQGVHTNYANFAAWQAAGYDAHGTAPSLPTSPEVAYITNDYETGRCFAVVANYPTASTATLDLSQCETGYPAQIEDVQNLGTTVWTGIGGGTVTVSMTDTSFLSPTGDNTASCWNTSCGSCSPAPSGCSQHAHPTASIAKTNSGFRTFLVRRQAASSVRATTVSVKPLYGSSTVTIQWQDSAAGTATGPATTVACSGSSACNATVYQPVGAAYYTVTYKDAGGHVIARSDAQKMQAS